MFFVPGIGLRPPRRSDPAAFFIANGVKASAAAGALDLRLAGLRGRRHFDARRPLARFGFAA